MPETIPPSSVGDHQASSRLGLDLLWLTLLCVLLFGAGLGRSTLNNPDEARYAEIPREMLATGDFVTPRLNGVKYFEKPPLVYWLVAGSLQVFGPGETAARAVPAIFGTLGVLLLYGTVRRLHGRDAARWAAFVLASSVLYLAHARILLVDMVVSVLISTVLCCFLLAVSEPAGPRRRWLLYGLYASAALATLAKGLIGFLLPGAVMFFWLLLFHQWRRLRPLYLPTGLLIFAIIAVPWHLLVAQRNLEWTWFYFVHEHWLRFTTTTHGRYEPWWFFLPIVIFGVFPWTGFLFHGVRQAVAGGWRLRTTHAANWFPLLWAGLILLFFSASKSKLIPYVLPVFPPLAWLMGRAIAELRTKADPFSWRGPLRVSAILAALLGTGLLVVVLKPGLIKSPEQLVQLRPLVWPAALALLAGGFICWRLARWNRPAAALTAILAASGILYTTLVRASPVVAHPSTKSLAEIVTREAGANALVLHYHEFFHDFTYYARRTVGTVAAESELEIFLDADAQRSGRFMAEADLQKLWAGPRQIFLVSRRRELTALQQQPWFHAKAVGETPGHILFSNHD